tara:strand:+ start:3023 stop:3241 length:219 start_codon:yes stop_codon:yes gene_type:complete
MNIVSEYCNGSNKNKYDYLVEQFTYACEKKVGIHYYQDVIGLTRNYNLTRVDVRRINMDESMRQLGRDGKFK